MGRKEEMAKAAEILMMKQADVRNIGIVAHIDHGKCVSPNTRLLFADGSIETAETIFENLSKKGKIVRENIGEVVCELTEESTPIFSLNKETGIMEQRNISHVWKLKGGKTLKVKLRNGTQVETTPEHPYIVFNGQDFIEKEARLISKGDYIVNARELQTYSNSDIKSCFLKNIADEKLYARLNPVLKREFAKHIRQNYSSIQRILPSGASKSALVANVRNGRYPILDILFVAKQMGISNIQLYDSIEWVSYRKGGKKSKSAKPMHLPSNMSNFFYLAGLLLGDGHEDKFIAGKPELGSRFVEILHELGIEPFYRNYPGRTPEISAGCKTLFAVLHALFDYPMGKKSHKIHLSPFALASSNDYLSALLKGYFDTDGTVEKSRRAISISSKSVQMLKDMQLALLRFGCQSIVQGDTLYITGKGSQKFIAKVGFGLHSKQEKATELARNAEGSRVLDLVPIPSTTWKNVRQNQSMSSISHHYYKYESKQLTPTFGVFTQLIQQMKKVGVDVQSMEKVNPSLAFIEVVDIQESHQDIVYDFTVPENHNFIAEGVIIHNTTLSDNLIAAAGLINKELAGKQQFMDYEDQEQERGITINAANISLVPTVNGKQYLINLIDTPGHVDFGGEVIRAMRAVDGIILVVDAVEGVMPQTETVIRQALRENVKPSLFINKVDRLIKELQVDQEEMQKRFVKTITQVNSLIKKNAPKGKEEEWQVNPTIGSVSFGSAYNHWAVSVPSMKRTGINFKQVYDYMKNDQQKELSEKSPLEDIVFEMIVKQLPNPLQAQKLRTGVIWSGEKETSIGKGMLECDPNAPVAMMITDVSVDQHAGDIATGRIYSGTIKKGTKIKLIGLDKEAVINRVGIYMGEEFVEITRIPAGSIGAIVGLKEAYAGQTVSEEAMKEFESFKTSVEPVITVSIEAKHTKDLPKLIEAIQRLSKEDPNLRASINQQTGEHLLSGMGELHLEINQYRIENTYKIPITVSTPIVVYHETVQKESPELEGKSPNRHNKLLMKVEPIPEDVLQKMIDKKLKGKVKPKDKEWIEKFVDCGLDKEEAKKVWAIQNNNLLIDGTKGIQALHEIRELVIQGFQDAMKEGPLAKEEVHGIKITLLDAKLHEDAIHRGPSQMIPTVVRTIYACMLAANAVLEEPKQLLTINTPQDYLGSVSKELQQRRTQISEIKNEGELTIIIGTAPVKELIGFSQSIRGATQGRVIWTGEYSGYELLPMELQQSTIESIRKRKGMDPLVKHYSFFLE